MQTFLAHMIEKQLSFQQHDLIEAETMSYFLYVRSYTTVERAGKFINTEYC